MQGLREIKIVFYGVDEWDRPVFREVYENDGKYWYGKKFFGDTDNLFCGLEKLIEDYKTGVDTLCYFGSYFGCEPRGDRPEEFGIKLIFDVDLTKKIKAGEIHVGETDVV